MSIFFKNLISKNKKKFLFIAELSANHAGDLKNAIRLIKLSKQNGADFVKFQTYEKSSMTLSSSKNEFLIKDGIWKNKKLWNLYEKAQTPFFWQKKLFKYANKEKIKAFSTPFDKKGVEILKDLKCGIIKVASLEANDFPLLNEIAKLKKPVIFSTGTSNLSEIKKTYKFLKKKGVKDIAILYCVSNYPSDYKDFNFNNISILKKEFNCVIGFSDHSNDLNVVKSAVAAGAEIIEKHVMLDNKIKTPDSKFSIKINEVSKLIKQLTVIKHMNNLNKDYFISRKELEVVKFRRSVFVIKKVNKNEKFSYRNIKCLRPNIGIPPEKYEQLINLKSPYKLDYGKPITKKLFNKIKLYNR